MQYVNLKINQYVIMYEVVDREIDYVFFMQFFFFGFVIIFLMDKFGN